MTEIAADPSESPVDAVGAEPADESPDLGISREPAAALDRLFWDEAKKIVPQGTCSERPMKVVCPDCNTSARITTRMGGMLSYPCNQWPYFKFDCPKCGHKGIAKALDISAVRYKWLTDEEIKSDVLIYVRYLEWEEWIEEMWAERQ